MNEHEELVDRLCREVLTDPEYAMLAYYRAYTLANPGRPLSGLTGADLVMFDEVTMVALAASIEVGRRISTGFPELQPGAMTRGRLMARHCRAIDGLDQRTRAKAGVPVDPRSTISGECRAGNDR